MEYEMRFHQGATNVRFEQYVIDHCPEGDDWLIRVIIKEGTNLIAIYYKEPNFSSVNQYHKFVKAFLEDPASRKNLETDGKEWHGTIPFVDPEKKVSGACLQAISHLNKKKEPHFSHFANLKTFGRDAFSAMSLSELERHVAPEVFQQVNNEFSDPADILCALRWAGRGLLTKWAIRKVKTDSQIRENAKKAKSRSFRAC